MSIKSPDGTAYSVHEVVTVAKVVHEINRVYCMALGDHSQVDWYHAATWQRDGTFQGVMDMIEKPDSTPAESHARWVEQKKADGWVWGPVKNPKLKQHPCMVPYDQLPEKQKAKDVLFTTVVRGLLDLPAPKKTADYTIAVESPNLDEFREIAERLETAAQTMADLFGRAR